MPDIPVEPEKTMLVGNTLFVGPRCFVVSHAAIVEGERGQLLVADIAEESPAFDLPANGIVTDETMRAISESIQRRAKRPASEQYREMVERGAIDAEGNVLIRGPEGSPTPESPEDELKVKDLAIHVIAKLVNAPDFDGTGWTMQDYEALQHAAHWVFIKVWERETGKALDPAKARQA